MLKREDDMNSKFSFIENNLLCYSILSAVFLHNTVSAAGYQFYELATPSIGTASVGQAAFANDASTAFFNPGGMGKLECSQMLLGTQLVNSQTQFRTIDLNTNSGGSGIKTNLIIP